MEWVDGCWWCGGWAEGEKVVRCMKEAKAEATGEDMGAGGGSGSGKGGGWWLEHETGAPMVKWGLLVRGRHALCVSDRPTEPRLESARMRAHAPSLLSKAVAFLPTALHRSAANT